MSLATSWFVPNQGLDSHPDHRFWSVSEGGHAQALESGFDPVALAPYWTHRQSRMIIHVMTWWAWHAPSYSLSKRPAIGEAVSLRMPTFPPVHSERKIPRPVPWRCSRIRSRFRFRSPSPPDFR